MPKILILFFVLSICGCKFKNIESPNSREVDSVRFLNYFQTTKIKGAEVILSDLKKSKKYSNYYFLTQDIYSDTIRECNISISLKCSSDFYFFYIKTIDTFFIINWQPFINTFNDSCSKKYYINNDLNLLANRLLQNQISPEIIAKKVIAPIIWFYFIEYNYDFPSRVYSAKNILTSKNLYLINKNNFDSFDSILNYKKAISLMLPDLDSTNLYYRIDSEKLSSIIKEENLNKVELKELRDCYIKKIQTYFQDSIKMELKLKESFYFYSAPNLRLIKVIFRFDKVNNAYKIYFNDLV